ncbi:hypothetical protein LOK49_LG11G01097 [Camellia lanceoleosa]|uniref:Uncharacterized protein n=1 Tax=Camellia lanceoleosa TaxID=1840588 RepID=A0ACC0G372_9ERIC|nr:hypothetical protein LOK49_LG11G01097 [Camellia lanceoleosa]
MQHKDSRSIYKTKFPMSYEGAEKEVTFFKNLDDDELNKVNRFYKDKVEQVLSEAAMLNKQMDALIALRIKVERPDFDGSGSLERLSMDFYLDHIGVIDSS